MPSGGARLDAATGDANHCAMTTPIRWWQHHTTTELARLVEDDPVVILPLAAIEQHGPHLPLSTDLDLGLGLLGEAFNRLPDDFPAVCLPALGIGSSTEHERFCGTLSLTPETLGRVIDDVGRSVANAGVRRLALFNSHGGNTHVAAMAALRLRREGRMLVVRCDYPRFPLPDDLLPAAERAHGIHGGAAETAMMLHLQPQRVRADRIPGATPIGETMATEFRRLGPTTPTPFAWMAQDLDPSGIAGNAALADAATGRRLVDHYATALAELLQEMRAFTLDRLIE